MITEDYVSFETAKLLKEKGFDWECICINYPPCGTSLIGHTINNTGLQLTREAELCIDKENLLTIPTLQMAMKWLREEKNIVIEINMDDYMTTEDGKLKIWYIYTIWTFIQHFGETGLVDSRFDDRAYWQKKC